MKAALRAYTFFALIMGTVFTASVKGTSGQGAIQIAKNEAIIEYPLVVRFELDARSSAEIESVTLLYSTNAIVCRGGQAQQEVDFDPGKRV